MPIYGLEFIRGRHQYDGMCDFFSDYQRCFDIINHHHLRFVHIWKGIKCHSVELAFGQRASSADILSTSRSNTWATNRSTRRDVTIGLE